MSQSQSASLLWINKDASNVHRKKHMADVNAHVQKGGVKRKPTKRPIGHTKDGTPTRAMKQDESSGLALVSSSESGPQHSDSASRKDSGEARHSVPLPHRSGRNTDAAHKSILIFSHYSEDDLQKQLEGLNINSDIVLPTEADLDGLSNQLGLSLPSSLDASNPLPGLLTDLSPRDKMLVHTHLTYMPQLFFGLSNRAVYCPIRTASVVNMVRNPIGTLWVLISLEMFLETARRSNERRHAILRRKTQAYQLMSKTFSEQTSSDDEGPLIAPVSAAIAELFCGDPDRALTHLNGLDAVLKARGGLKYIRKMDVAASMPIYAVFAYRTLLQDNIPTPESFLHARFTFVGMIKSFIEWNRAMLLAAIHRSHGTPGASPQDEGFDGEYDVAEGVNDLNQARLRAFVDHGLMRKFVTPDFVYSKPGEKVDHFLILYNLNLAFLDHGTASKQVIRFIEDFVQDVELGGSTSDESSSINVSGVLRLLTNRQVKMHLHVPGAGVARAWEALDALEIMKLLPQEQQKSVCRSLHALLVGQVDSAMGEEDIAAIDSMATTEWFARHPDHIHPHG